MPDNNNEQFRPPVVLRTTRPALRPGISHNNENRRPPRIGHQEPLPPPPPSPDRQEFQKVNVTAVAEARGHNASAHDIITDWQRDRLQQIWRFNLVKKFFVRSREGLMHFRHVRDLEQAMAQNPNGVFTTQLFANAEQAARYQMREHGGVIGTLRNPGMILRMLTDRVGVRREYIRQYLAAATSEQQVAQGANPANFTFVLDGARSIRNLQRRGGFTEGRAQALLTADRGLNTQMGRDARNTQRQQGADELRNRWADQGLRLTGERGFVLNEQNTILRDAFITEVMAPFCNTNNTAPTQAELQTALRTFIQRHQNEGGGPNGQRLGDLLVNPDELQSFAGGIEQSIAVIRQNLPDNFANMQGAPVAELTAAAGDVPAQLRLILGDVFLGSRDWGINSREQNNLERGVNWVRNLAVVGRYVSPEAAALVISVGGASLQQLIRRGAVIGAGAAATIVLGPLAIPFAAAAIGGVFAAGRGARERQRDVRRHQGMGAAGELTTQAGYGQARSIRERMNPFRGSARIYDTYRMDTVRAIGLVNTLRRVPENTAAVANADALAATMFTTPTTDEQAGQLLTSIVDARARLRVGRDRGIDLIGYSGREQVQQEQAVLTRAIALATEALAGYNNGTFSARIPQEQQTREAALNTEVRNVRNMELANRVAYAARQGVVGAVMGFFVGSAFQEAQEIFNASDAGHAVSGWLNDRAQGLSHAGIATLNARDATWQDQVGYRVRPLGEVLSNVPEALSHYFNSVGTTKGEYALMALGHMTNQHGLSSAANWLMERHTAEIQMPAANFLDQLAQPGVHEVTNHLEFVTGSNGEVTIFESGSDGAMHAVGVGILGSDHTFHNLLFLDGSNPDAGSEKIFIDELHRTGLPNINFTPDTSSGMNLNEELQKQLQLDAKGDVPATLHVGSTTIDVIPHQGQPLEIIIHDPAHPNADVHGFFDQGKGQIIFPENQNTSITHEQLLAVLKATGATPETSTQTTDLADWLKNADVQGQYGFIEGGKYDPSNWEWRTHLYSPDFYSHNELTMYIGGYNGSDLPAGCVAFGGKLDGIDIPSHLPGIPTIDDPFLQSLTDANGGKIAITDIVVTARLHDGTLIMIPVTGHGAGLPPGPPYYAQLPPGLYDAQGNLQNVDYVSTAVVTDGNGHFIDHADLLKIKGGLPAGYKIVSLASNPYEGTPDTMNQQMTITSTSINPSGAPVATQRLDFGPLAQRTASGDEVPFLMTIINRRNNVRYGQGLSSTAPIVTPRIPRTRGVPPGPRAPGQQRAPRGQNPRTNILRNLRPGNPLPAIGNTARGVGTFVTSPGRNNRITNRLQAAMNAPTAAQRARAIDEALLPEQQMQHLLNQGGDRLVPEEVQDRYFDRVGEILRNPDTQGVNVDARAHLDELYAQITTATPDNAARAQRIYRDAVAAEVGILVTESDPLLDTPEMRGVRQQAMEDVVESRTRGPRQPAWNVGPQTNLTVAELLDEARASNPDNEEQRQAAIDAIITPQDQVHEILDGGREGTLVPEEVRTAYLTELGDLFINDGVEAQDLRVLRRAATRAGAPEEARQRYMERVAAIARERVENDATRDELLAGEGYVDARYNAMEATTHADNLVRLEELENQRMGLRQLITETRRWRNPTGPQGIGQAQEVRQGLRVIYQAEEVFRRGERLTRVQAEALATIMEGGRTLTLIEQYGVNRLANAIHAFRDTINPTPPIPNDPVWNIPGSLPIDRHPLLVQALLNATANDIPTGEFQTQLEPFLDILQTVREEGVSRKPEKRTNNSIMAIANFQEQLFAHPDRYAHHIVALNNLYGLLVERRNGPLTQEQTTQADGLLAQLVQLDEQAGGIRPLRTFRIPQLLISRIHKANDMFHAQPEVARRNQIMSQLYDGLVQDIPLANGQFEPGYLRRIVIAEGFDTIVQRAEATIQTQAQRAERTPRVTAEDGETASYARWREVLASIGDENIDELSRRVNTRFLSDALNHTRYLQGIEDLPVNVRAILIPQVMQQQLAENLLHVLDTIPQDQRTAFQTDYEDEFRQISVAMQQVRTQIAQQQPVDGVRFFLQVEEAVGYTDLQRTLESQGVFPNIILPVVNRSLGILVGDDRLQFALDDPIVGEIEQAVSAVRDSLGIQAAILRLRQGQGERAANIETMYELIDSDIPADLRQALQRANEAVIAQMKRGGQITDEQIDEIFGNDHAEMPHISVYSYDGREAELRSVQDEFTRALDGVYTQQAIRSSQTAPGEFVALLEAYTEEALHRVYQHFHEDMTQPGMPAVHISRNLGQHGETASMDAVDIAEQETGELQKVRSASRGEQWRQRANQAWDAATHLPRTIQQLRERQAARQQAQVDEEWQQTAVAQGYRGQLSREELDHLEYDHYTLRDGRLVPPVKPLSQPASSTEHDPSNFDMSLTDIPLPRMTTPHADSGPIPVPPLAETVRTLPADFRVRQGNGDAGVFDEPRRTLRSRNRGGAMATDTAAAIIVGPEGVVASAYPRLVPDNHFILNPYAQVENFRAVANRQPPTLAAIHIDYKTGVMEVMNRGQDQVDILFINQEGALTRTSIPGVRGQNRPREIDLPEDAVQVLLVSHRLLMRKRAVLAEPAIEAVWKSAHNAQEFARALAQQTGNANIAGAVAEISLTDFPQSRYANSSSGIFGAPDSFGNSAETAFPYIDSPYPVTNEYMQVITEEDRWGGSGITGDGVQRVGILVHAGASRPSAAIAVGNQAQFTAIEADFSLGEQTIRSALAAVDDIRITHRYTYPSPFPRTLIAIEAMNPNVLSGRREGEINVLNIGREEGYLFIVNADGTNARRIAMPPGRDRNIQHIPYVAGDAYAYVISHDLGQRLSQEEFTRLFQQTGGNPQHIANMLNPEQDIPGAIAGVELPFSVRNVVPSSVPTPMAPQSFIPSSSGEHTAPFPAASLHAETPTVILPTPLEQTPAHMRIDRLTQTRSGETIAGRAREVFTQATPDERVAWAPAIERIISLMRSDPQFESFTVPQTEQIQQALRGAGPDARMDQIIWSMMSTTEAMPREVTAFVTRGLNEIFSPTNLQRSDTVGRRIVSALEEVDKRLAMDEVIQEATNGGENSRYRTEPLIFIPSGEVNVSGVDAGEQSGCVTLYGETDPRDGSIEGGIFITVTPEQRFAVANRLRNYRGPLMSVPDIVRQVPGRTARTNISFRAEMAQQEDRIIAVNDGVDPANIALITIDDVGEMTECRIVPLPRGERTVVQYAAHENMAIILPENLGQQDNGLQITPGELRTVLQEQAREHRDDESAFQAGVIAVLSERADIHRGNPSGALFLTLQHGERTLSDTAIRELPGRTELGPNYVDSTIGVWQGEGPHNIRGMANGQALSLIGGDTPNTVSGLSFQLAMGLSVSPLDTARLTEILGEETTPLYGALSEVTDGERHTYLYRRGTTPVTFFVIAADNTHGEGNQILRFPLPYEGQEVLDVTADIANLMGRRGYFVVSVPGEISIEAAQAFSLSQLQDRTRNGIAQHIATRLGELNFPSVNLGVIEVPPADITLEATDTMPAIEHSVDRDAVLPARLPTITDRTAYTRDYTRMLAEVSSFDWRNRVAIDQLANDTRTNRAVLDILGVDQIPADQAEFAQAVYAMERDLRERMVSQPDIYQELALQIQQAITENPGNIAAMHYFLISLTGYTREQLTPGNPDGEAWRVRPDRVTIQGQGDDIDQMLGGESRTGEWHKDERRTNEDLGVGYRFSGGFALAVFDGISYAAFPAVASQTAGDVFLQTFAAIEANPPSSRIESALTNAATSGAHRMGDLADLFDTSNEVRGPLLSTLNVPVAEEMATTYVAVAYVEATHELQIAYAGDGTILLIRADGTFEEVMTNADRAEDGTLSRFISPNGVNPTLRKVNVNDDVVAIAVMTDGAADNWTDEIMRAELEERLRETLTNGGAPQDLAHLLRGGDRATGDDSTVIVGRIHPAATSATRNDNWITQEPLVVEAPIVPPTPAAIHDELQRDIQTFRTEGASGRARLRTIDDYRLLLTRIVDLRRIPAIQRAIAQYDQAINSSDGGNVELLPEGDVIARLIAPFEASPADSNANPRASAALRELCDRLLQLTIDDLTIA